MSNNNASSTEWNGSSSCPAGEPGASGHREPAEAEPQGETPRQRSAFYRHQEGQSGYLREKTEKKKQKVISRNDTEATFF